MKRLYKIYRPVQKIIIVINLKRILPQSMGIEKVIGGNEDSLDGDLSHQQYAVATPPDEHEYLPPLQLEQHWERVHQYQRNVITGQDEED